MVASDQGTPSSQSVKAHEKRKAEIKMQGGAQHLQGEGQRMLQERETMDENKYSFENIYCAGIKAQEKIFHCHKCGREIRVSLFDPAGPERCPYCQANNWWEDFDNGEKNMLGAHYSEEIMDELVNKMVEFLTNHNVYKLLELVADAVATKEQE